MNYNKLMIQIKGVSITDAPFFISQNVFINHKTILR